MILLKTSAIICEYNPLHNGHMYQIEITKKLTQCEGLIAIMSGNYVQRGEPAIIDKWQRTKIALNSGIDLVIELPTAYALSSAEYFSHGAVSILNKLNIVDSLCFGSECGDVKPLMKIAEILCSEPAAYKTFLRDYLNLGLTFPLARSKALQKYFSKVSYKDDYNYYDILLTSNNILGIEYCKSLLRNNSNIVPYTITRLGSGYNDDSLGAGFSSATAIRKFLKDNNSLEEIKEKLPKSSFDIIMQLRNNNYDFTYADSMFNYIKYKSQTDTSQSLKKLQDAGEGLYNRIYKFIDTSNSMKDLINNIKTKRYTYTRIGRLLTQYFIGFEKFSETITPDQSCDYIRVLGFNKTGADILNSIKRNSSLEIITKVPRKIVNPMLELDIISTKTYSIINKNIRSNEDYLTSPIFL